MDLLGAYGSDNEDDDNAAAGAMAAPTPAVAPVAAAMVARKVISVGIGAMPSLFNASNPADADDVADDWPKKRKEAPVKATSTASFLSMLPAPKNSAAGGLGGGKGALLGGLQTSLSAGKKEEEEREAKRAATEARIAEADTANQAKTAAEGGEGEEYAEGEEEEYWEEEEEGAAAEEEQPIMGPTMPSQAARMQYTVVAAHQPAYVPYQGFFGEQEKERTEAERVIDSLPAEFRRDKLLRQAGVQGRVLEVSQRDIFNSALAVRQEQESAAPLLQYGSGKAPVLAAPQHKLSARKGQLGFLAYAAQNLDNETLLKAQNRKAGGSAAKQKYGW